MRSVTDHNGVEKRVDTAKVCTKGKILLLYYCISHVQKCRLSIIEMIISYTYRYSASSFAPKEATVTL